MEQTVVRMTSPADLVLALPHLLGFPPQESLVVGCLTGPRRRLGLVMRLDLPGPEDERGVAAEVVERARRQGADDVFVVCVTARRGGETGREGLAYRGLVDALLAGLRAVGIGATEVLLARGGRWWSYACTGPCCPAEGSELPPLSASAALHYAAESALLGRAPLPGRDALAASVEPGLHGVRAAGLLLAYAAADEAVEAALQLGGARQLRRETLHLLQEAAAAYAQGSPGLEDVTAARITLGLVDRVTRDQALTMVLDVPCPALTLLWTDLARLTPDVHAAPVCALLATVAYVCGDGALANVALERALAADPGYELARLPPRPQNVAVSGSGPMRRPDARPLTSAMSASESSKSKTSMLDRMRSGVTDFGITTVPRCTCQRRTTWAGVRPTRVASPVTTGCSSSPLPAPIGLQAWVTMPCSSWKARSSSCGSSGCSSTWLAAGTTSVSSNSRCRWACVKFETPIARTRPSE
ncbi:DUF4192 domain-containing protein [Motilibacter sp. K478]|nr:DUF4192 domain-containing protein [Motilibacter aurantiacus]